MNKEGDAFQRLYDANRKRVLGFLTRVAGSQDAEDLAQIVFLKAARALPDFRGDAETSTWLYRIAANVAADWLRGRPALEANVTVQMPNALEHAELGPAASSESREDPASPEQELARKEMRECIRRLIGQLPEKYWIVLMLGELGGLSHDEVAETLGISRGAAKVRLHRAREQLKKKLEAHCTFARNEDNEFICEPKPAVRRASSRRLG